MARLDPALLEERVARIRELLEKDPKSVAAVLGGAREVVSVDLSSGVLRWARENFRLAGLDPELHRFHTDDTMRYLRQAARAGEIFDLVILDPPTYSAARAAAWSMKKDLAEVIARALALLPPGGVLWLCCNSHQLTDAELELRLQEGVRAAGRTVTLLESGGLPPDYPTVITSREERYLRLRVLRCL